jgi:hypothetical protein
MIYSGGKVGHAGNMTYPPSLIADISAHHPQELELLTQLAAAESLVIYLVGGCVRDQLLKRRSADYDLVSAGDPTNVAKLFARQINGKWFWLDKTRCYSRVIAASSGGNEHTSNDDQKYNACLQFDFAPLRADSIAADLALRDFTINAMALALYPRPADATLIDPLGGTQDLAQRCLRMCGNQVLFQDPLRILKGLRHCSQLDFTPDTATQHALQNYAPLLKQVAGERIRSELGLLLGGNNPEHALTLLFNCGVAEVLGFAGDATQVLAGYARLKNIIERVVGRSSNLPDAIFLQPIGDDYSLKVLLHFAVILRSCNVKAKALDDVVLRLHFQRRVAQCLSFAVNISTDELTMFAQLQCSRRGKLLWLHQQNAPLPEGLLICALLDTVDIDVTQLEQLYVSCQQLLHNGRIMPLLTSDHIQAMFPQCSGHQLGKLFKQLAHGEISGQVWTAQQGESYLKKCYERRSRKNALDG